MEKVAQSERKALFIKILPFVILGISLLTIGLSFIGKFYDVLLEGETVQYKLASLLTEDHLGPRIRFFFWIVYIVMPLLASGLIFFYKKNKNFAFVAMLIFLTCGIVCLVTKDVFPQALYYRFKTILGRKVSIEIEELYFASIVPVVSYFILSLLVLSFASEDIKFSTKDITESGVLIAAALALNFIRLFPAPTGGSVNLQMLPLFILAIRKGPVKAFVGCGIVYGLISCLTDGYGFATFPFDYLLGIGSTAILGLFSKQILNENIENYNLKGELFLFIGVALATTMRFVAGTISSMLIYDYEIVPAMIYNVGYIFISGAIALAVIMALYGPISKINKQFPSK
jgi:thiamine transporter